MLEFLTCYKTKGAAGFGAVCPAAVANGKLSNTQPVLKGICQMNEGMCLPPARHFFLDEILLSPLPPSFPLSFFLAGLSDMKSKFETWGASHFISRFLRTTKALGNDGEMEQTQ